MAIDKTKIKYFLDIGMGISFLAVFFTGLIKFLVIYRLINIGRGAFNMALMSRIHDYSGIIMGLFVLVHLIFNFNWIVCVTKGFFTKKRVCKR